MADIPSNMTMDFKTEDDWSSIRANKERKNSLLFFNWVFFYFFKIFFILNFFSSIYLEFFLDFFPWIHLEFFLDFFPWIYLAFFLDFFPWIYLEFFLDIFSSIFVRIFSSSFFLSFSLLFFSIFFEREFHLFLCNHKWKYVCHLRARDIRLYFQERISLKFIREDFCVLKEWVHSKVGQSGRPFTQ